MIQTAATVNVILNNNRRQWPSYPPTPTHTASDYRHYDYDYDPPETNSARSCRLYCIFFIFLALVILILTVKFEEPEIDLQQVGVQNMSIGPTTPCSTAVSLNVSMSFSVTNHNKYGIKYKESRLTVTYGDVPLGSGTIESFDQPAHSGKQIETSVVVHRVSLIQPDAGNLVRDVSLHDRVEFRVVGHVTTRDPMFWFYAFDVPVSVDCKIAISPRRKALISKQCDDGHNEYVDCFIAVSPRRKALISKKCAAGINY